MWKTIAAHISQVTGEPFNGTDSRSVGGGCINRASTLSDGKRTYFVKLNQAAQIEMFAAEALGLQQIWDTQTIRVPQPICWGSEGDTAYIVLEWLDLGRGNDQNWFLMGQQLAAMHQVTSKPGFGWDRNNTIGSTPQIKDWATDWPDFFAEHRIGYQLSLAGRRGGNFGPRDRILAAVRQQLRDRTPPPSLLHGDLWSGNAAITTAGEPIILDPATYFGDREADLAMTELFGGFPAAFYRGYNDTFPLDSGYKQRKSLYNLYHILNHFNLFGGGYSSQAQRIINRLLQ